MSDIEEFKKLVERQQRIEKESVERYDEYSKVLDEDMQKKVKDIIEDEKEHVEIVGGMLELIEDYEGSFERENGQKKLFSEEDIYSAMILVSDLESYMYDILEFIEGINDIRDIKYLSYNKIPSRIKQELDESSGISREDVTFLNCSSEGDENIDPDSLTDISLAIKESFEDEKAFVLVDNITTFTSKHPEESIVNFVSSLNDNARERDKEVLWVAVESDEYKELVNKLVQLCDKKIEL